MAVPLRLIVWGDPAALSWTTIAPLRVPGAVGVKVTENVQLPAARTPVAQSSVSAKSPVVVIEEIDSDALPMLRSRSVCGWLETPTACTGNCRRPGAIATEGSEPGPILKTKASGPPPEIF